MSVGEPTVLYYSIFQQLFKFIPRYRFDKKTDETSGNRYCKHFSAWRQFLTCLYAQITGKDSLREVASGLMTNKSRLYHLGMKAVAKTPLADAMNRRSPEIFKALFEEINAPSFALRGTDSNFTIRSTQSTARPSTYA